MVFYDDNNPAGVVIDGVPDVITATPPGSYAEFAGVAGTVVSVGRAPAGLGGTHSTYYKDDSILDGEDTGDQRSYGDTGLQVENPTPGIYVSLGHLYLLTGTTTSVGAMFAESYDHPLEVSLAPVSEVWKLYLPFAFDE